MLPICLLATALTVAQAPPAASRSETPERLAVGTIRSVVSAQAYHKQAFPAIGYACDIETLVRAQALLDSLSAGKPFNGYVFRVWCETKNTPQTTFRASAIPAKRAEGSNLTACADETNVPRTVQANLADCFAKGIAAQ
jgi:hypothetical protein